MTERLRRSIDTDEDHLSVGDGAINITRKREVLAERRPKYLVKTRLVDRRHARLPRADALSVDIGHHDSDVRAVFRNHRHRRAAHIPGTDTENLLDHRLILSDAGPG